MKNFTKFLMVIVLILFGQLTTAQINVVAPNALESTTTTGTFTGPLANSARSYQLIINQSELTSLIGTAINGISFRSIASASTTWPDVEAVYNNYDIYLSQSVAPANRSLTFSENIIGTQVQVRSGALTIQANSYGPGGATGFGPTIEFNSAYIYTGGHLVVEIRHSGTSTLSRSVEAVLTSNSMYSNQVSAAWGSGYTSAGGTQGNAAVIRFSATTAENVAVTNLEVSTENDVPAEITTEGGTLQLVAEITPANATNQNVVWSVESGSEFATVDQNGLVTAIANGSATIRATSAENNTIFDEIEITIDYVIAVASIEVSTLDNVPAEITTEGGTLQLIATILPSNADNQDVIWSVSSGNELATVDQDGLVTALGNGTATIRATWTDDEAIFGEIEVTIDYAIAVETIEVSTLDDVPAEITTEGGTLQLIATILPSNANNQEVIWSVSNGNELATVDQDGLVTALGNGTATIRATWTDDENIFGEIEVSISVLSVPSNNLAVFNFYPNPTKDVLYFSSNIEIQEIIIFNILGQKIKQQSLSSNQGEIDFTDLENGNYILKIISIDNQVQNHIISKK